MGIKALAYPVPEHANNLTWSLGGLTAVAFVILLVTGVYVARFYAPVPEDANQSVRDLVTDVWLGGFARAVRYWAAQAMFVLALLHLLRVFLHASYKKPREGNWVVGSAMFLLTFLAVFTGTVLKWDQEGSEALIHNLDVAELLGGAGAWFTSELTDRVPLLLRLYSAHVVIIPGLTLLLFRMARAAGQAAPDLRASRDSSTGGGGPRAVHGPPAAGGCVRTGAAGAAVAPRGTAATSGRPDPRGRGRGDPAAVDVLVVLFERSGSGSPPSSTSSRASFGLVFLVPFLDRSPKRRWRERKVALSAAVVLLLALAATTIQVWA